MRFQAQSDRTPKQSNPRSSATSCFHRTHQMSINHTLLSVSLRLERASKRVSCVQDDRSEANDDAFRALQIVFRAANNFQLHWLENILQRKLDFCLQILCSSLLGDKRREAERAHKTELPDIKCVKAEDRLILKQAQKCPKISFSFLNTF